LSACALAEAASRKADAKRRDCFFITSLGENNDSCPRNSISRNTERTRRDLDSVIKARRGVNMSVQVHNILTGELESSYSTSVFGAPDRHPLVKKEELLPYGYKERRYNRDGTFEPGLMVPVPVWFIEGEDSCILIDTRIRRL
jgi:hypothetical protein